MSRGKKKKKEAHFLVSPHVTPHELRKKANSSRALHPAQDVRYDHLNPRSIGTERHSTAYRSVGTSERVFRSHPNSLGFREVIFKSHKFIFSFLQRLVRFQLSPRFVRGANRSY